MRRPTLTLARSLLAVASFGVGIAAFRNATPLWAGVGLIVVLTFLFTSPLGVLYSRGPARANWLGFGVFAWGYGLLALGPWAPDLRDRLPTTALFAALHEALHPDIHKYSEPISHWKLSRLRATHGPLQLWLAKHTRYSHKDNTCEIGHQISTLSFGLFGLLIARLLHFGKDRSG